MPREEDSWGPGEGRTGSGRSEACQPGTVAHHEALWPGGVEMSIFGAGMEPCGTHCVRGSLVEAAGGRQPGRKAAHPGCWPPCWDSGG